MEKLTFHEALIIIYAIGFGSATCLVVSGHPWFGLLAFILTAFAQVSDTKRLAIGDNAKFTSYHFSIVRGIVNAFKKDDTTPLTMHVTLNEPDLTDERFREFVLQTIERAKREGRADTDAIRLSTLAAISDSVTDSVEDTIEAVKR